MGEIFNKNVLRKRFTLGKMASIATLIMLVFTILTYCDTDKNLNVDTDINSNVKINSPQNSSFHNESKSESKMEIKQNTTGNQSPAFISSGSVNINFNADGQETEGK
jgi:hypothetical protein